MVTQSHLPYAELICDTAAVLLNRNPKSFPEIFDVLYERSASNAAARTVLDRARRDQPQDLASRDFSVPFEDPRWNSFLPQDMIYNRFNQIRSYLWQRHIQNLPPEEVPRFFAKLIQVIDSIQRSGHLDALMSINGVPASNEALLRYLEQNL